MARQAGHPARAALREERRKNNESDATACHVRRGRNAEAGNIERMKKEWMPHVAASV
jgi:hypothetical protein